jgi:hypothetical protein
MANVTVSGNLFATDGTVIPLQATIAEGTESNLTTNTTYSVTASNVGDYAPGKTIMSGYVQSANSISYAYILRQGVIEALIPIGKKGISPVAYGLCRPFTLQAGDIVRVMVNTAADRECAVYAYTNRGVSRIFTVTPTGAATNEPVDLQTGLSVGETLQGQVIVKALATSVDGNKIDGGGAVMLNEKGMPAGVVPINTVQETAPYFSDVSIPVALNYQWAVVTSS